jgi:hypothetical protein
MSMKQQYEAYLAECNRTDTSRHSAILREHTEQEQEFYEAWQAAIRNCTTWRDDEGTTWYVLSKYRDGGLEMWTCRIVTSDNPQGEIADCYAWAIRESAQPVDEESQVEV